MAEQREVGIEHVHLRDIDPRDDRMLRITPWAMNRAAKRLARDILTAQKRFTEARELTSDKALEVLAEWDLESLKMWYARGSLSLGDFEAILDVKFGATSGVGWPE